MNSRRTQMIALLLALAAHPLQGQITHTHLWPPVEPDRVVGEPNFEASPLSPCAWPDSPDSRGPRVDLEVTEGAFYLPSKPRFDTTPTKKTATGRLLTTPKSTWWLTAERGNTGLFNGAFRPWFYLVGMITSGSVSVGCNDCLRVTNRCHEIRDGRNLYVAWGQQDGGWGNHDFEVLSAIELGPDQWLVVWGGGPSEEAINRMLTVIDGVEL